VWTAGQDAALYRAVDAACALCRSLEIGIPVGKDSLSMSTQWRQADQEKRVRAPISLIVSAAAAVGDVRRSLTPQLRLDGEPTDLVLIDLSRAACAWRGRSWHRPPASLAAKFRTWTIRRLLQGLLSVIRKLATDGRLLAYHDRSGRWSVACACEMAFAASCGIHAQYRCAGGRPAGLWTRRLSDPGRTAERASQRCGPEGAIQRGAWVPDSDSAPRPHGRDGCACAAPAWANAAT